MVKVKRVAIYLPFCQKNSKKKRGLLPKDEVRKVEKLLAENKNLKYLGNVNFKKLKISGNKFSCDGVDLARVDLFFWYTPRMQNFSDELRLLSKFTRVIKSPQSFETIADKFKAHTVLKKKRLPVADFTLIDYDNLALMKKLIKKWKMVLVKPRLGSFGRGIIKVSDFETLRDITGYLKMEHKQKQVFVEKFYENDFSQWISTTIIGGKVIYGYRKKRKKFAGWKVYDLKARGGDAFYVDPEPVRKIAEKAAQVLDKSIVGFDFIKTREGYKIVDENNFPGFYPEAFRAAGKKGSKLIADLIISQV